MKMVEFASAEEQLALWRLVSDNVWAAISKQAKDEAEAKALKRAQAKAMPKRKKSLPPPFAAPPPKLPQPIRNVQLPANKPALNGAAQQPSQAQLAAKAYGVQPKVPAGMQQTPGWQQTANGQ